jgi:uncharacterized protein (DUF1501 family)
VGGGGGAYANLMGTLGDGLGAFYTDIRNQGLAADTTIIVFSEFSRRVSENGSAGTDHGAAGVMMVLGGAVRGGLYGTAPQLSPDTQRSKTTLEMFTTRPTSGLCMRASSTTGWGWTRCRFSTVIPCRRAGRVLGTIDEERDSILSDAVRGGGHGWRCTRPRPPEIQRHGRPTPISRR